MFNYQAYKIFCLQNNIFRVSPAESLPVEDNSVTLIQAAAALHWLNYEKFYRECDRVLVPGGVIAAFSYTLNIHFDHPMAAEIAEVFLEVWKVLAYF